MLPTLQARKHELASSEVQLQLLNYASEKIKNLTPFQQKLQASNLFPLRPQALEILQVNVGKICNQTCMHCHVDAGPDRKEIMTQATMQKILQVLSTSCAHTIDITGGAPEMNPHFRWFVQELAQLNKKIMVRSNLTIMLAGNKYRDLPDFFKAHRVHVVSSLPCYTQAQTDAQRGEGVFETSLQALKMLNQVGYGKPNSELLLDLVYNPGGAFLPGKQSDLEQAYKYQLSEHFGIEFNHLYTITNMPIARFLTFLLDTGKLEEYMEKLVQSFNPAAAQSVMCRNTLSVGWDGRLYDCDFNQMLELPVDEGQTLDTYQEELLANRNIIVNQHCYGCTAGAGSSCSGATV